MPQQNADRRRYKRFDIIRPVHIEDTKGAGLAEGRMINISDGGAYVSIDPMSLPDLTPTILMKFSIPRQTSNTFLLEDITAAGRVIRRQSLHDARHAVAVEFEHKINLAIEL